MQGHRRPRFKQRRPAAPPAILPLKLFVVRRRRYPLLTQLAGLSGRVLHIHISLPPPAITGLPLCNACIRPSITVLCIACRRAIVPPVSAVCMHGLDLCAWAFGAALRLTSASQSQPATGRLGGHVLVLVATTSTTVPRSQNTSMPRARHGVALVDRSHECHFTSTRPERPDRAREHARRRGWGTGST